MVITFNDKPNTFFIDNKLYELDTDEQLYFTAYEEITPTEYILCYKNNGKFFQDIRLIIKSDSIEISKIYNTKKEKKYNTKFIIECVIGLSLLMIIPIIKIVK